MVKRKQPDHVKAICLHLQQLLSLDALQFVHSLTSMPPFLTTPQPSSDTLPSSGTEPLTAMMDEMQSSDSDTLDSQMFENWAGWAEVENDPAIFSTLLREWGVPSVRVQEVFQLDSLFDESANSVFGLVLLARWTAPEEETEYQLTTAPGDLWFANQVCLFGSSRAAC